MTHPMFQPGPMSGHIEFIQNIIDACDYTSYLEIGTFKDECFAAIECTTKVGVDPISGGTLRMTSDEFFHSNRIVPPDGERHYHQRFDIVFIDGDHHEAQVLRDVHGAAEILLPNGLIVMHDCNPPSAHYESEDFCGTAWRAFVRLRSVPYFDAIVADFDFGVGLLRRKKNSVPWFVTDNPTSVLTYETLDNNRADLLRLTRPYDALAWAARFP